MFALVVVGLCVISAAQASAATIYWSADDGVRTQQIDDTSSGAPAGSSTTVSADCKHNWSWAANSTTFFGPDGSNICQMRLDGTGTASTLVATGCGGLGVGGIYATDQYVYWACMQTSRVGRVDVGGTNAILDFTATPAGPNDNYTTAISGDANWLYVGNNGASSCMRRYHIDGTGVDPSFSICNIGDMRGIDVDGRYVYWAVNNGSAIGRAKIDGSAQNRTWLASGSDTFGVTVTGSAIFWTRRGGSIGRADINGANANPDWITGANITSGNEHAQLKVVGGTAKLLPLPSPVNTEAPAVTGTAQVDAMLISGTGTWTNPPSDPSGYTYLWQVSDNGESGWATAAGTGAATASYYPAPAEYAKFLRVQVTATNDGGSTPGYSMATSAVLPVAPANSALPSITGSPAVDSQLVADPGAWTSQQLPTGYAYQWQESDDGSTGWTDIPDATATSFTPRLADDAKFLRVQVTATNDAGPTVVYSLATAPVDMPTPTWSIDSQPMGVGVSGTVRIHSVLTSSPATWHYATAPLAYQWQVSADGVTGWTNATGVGATDNQYEISAADSGKYLRVVQTASNRLHDASAESAATIAVPATPYNELGADRPEITGTVQVGQTLTASTGTWTNPPATSEGYSYEWQVATGPFGPWTRALGEGADTAEYDVDLTDDGKSLRVVVTADNGVGSYAANSMATDAVALLAPDWSEAPQITGTIQIGSTLTASTGTWDVATDYAYAWQTSADGSTWEAASGTGAATSSYTVVAADSGRYLRVRVTGSNRIGSLAVASAASIRVPSPVSPVANPPSTAPAPVFSPAPGITVGETRGEANLAAATPAAGADLLRGANIWVRSTSRVEYVADALPEGLKLVNGKLVASKPGTYQVKVKVKRANGTTVMRKIKIKVG